jgi:hypothetical protein
MMSVDININGIDGEETVFIHKDYILVLLNVSPKPYTVTCRGGTQFSIAHNTVGGQLDFALLEKA